MYFIVDKVDGFIEEKEGSEYLNFALTDNNNAEVLEKYVELWNGIKSHIRKINDKPGGEYADDFMKIKFNSDDSLPLDKPLKVHMLLIIVRSVFKEDGKYHPQLFLD